MLYRSLLAQLSLAASEHARAASTDGPIERDLGPYRMELVLEDDAAFMMIDLNDQPAPRSCVLLHDDGRHSSFDLSEPVANTIQYGISRHDPQNAELIELLKDPVTSIYLQNEPYCDPNGKIGAPTPGRKSLDAYTVVDIFYATDRNRLASDRWQTAYGAERSKVSYGMCEVTIPKMHQQGKLEAPSYRRLQFREDPKKHVMLQQIRPNEKGIYFETLRERINQSTGKNAFIYVHGFNVTFEDAARRTAQIAFDIGFDGAPVFYSWPSRGHVTSYVADKTNVRWAEKNLLNFLRDFVDKTDADNIYLIAHSMGNRALAGAVMTLIAEQPALKKRFREIILAAPDIDAELFRRDIAPKMIEASDNITLYVSADDNALLASRRIHEYPRAGEAGENIIIMDGIDTVDATGLDASLVAHSYIVEVKSIIADLLEIIRHGKRAAARPMLRKVDTVQGAYWAFVER
jgi:esterase/lipase superfamily enzyme